MPRIAAKLGSRAADFLGGLAWVFTRRVQGTMLPMLDMTRVKRLLCLGAHCDDIEIGAGGTIMRLAQAYPQIEVRWVILAGEDPMRVEEARRSAEVFLSGTGTSEISIYGFRDGFLPFPGELGKEAFEEIGRGQ